MHNLLSLCAQWDERFLEQLTNPAIDLTPSQHWVRLTQMIRSDGYPIGMAASMAEAMMKVYFPDWKRIPSQNK